MDPLTRRERIGLWLSMNEALAGFLLVASAGLVFGTIILLVMVPIGPATEWPGRIAAIGNLETDEGSYPRAVVWLPPGRTVVAQLARRHVCGIGDPVVVVATPKVWGTHNAVKRIGCAA